MPAADLRHPLTPAFELSINGAPVSAEMSAHVVAVTVDENVELPAMFTVELVGSIELDEPVPWVDDEDAFTIGNTFEIKLGYKDSLDTIFTGELTGLEPEFGVNGLSRLVARGYDRSHRLRRGRQTRTFLQQKDSDIASQIASDAGLTADVTDSQVTYEYVLQPNQTDLDFLNERARLIEYEVVVEDQTLHFRPAANAESEALTLSVQEGLLEFCPRLSSMGQFSEVAVRSWSVKDKENVAGQAKAGDVTSSMGGQQTGAQLVEGAFGAAIEQISTHPVMTAAEADQLAKARLNDQALRLVCAEGVCYGRTDLRAGKVIKLDGIGTRFSGQYYVTAAQHQYTARRGYQTLFKVRRNAS